LNVKVQLTLVNSQVANVLGKKIY